MPLLAFEVVSQIRSKPVSSIDNQGESTNVSMINQHLEENPPALFTALATQWSDIVQGRVPLARHSVPSSRGALKYSNLKAVTAPHPLICFSMEAFASP